MLQVFYIDVVKVNRDVAYVVMVGKFYTTATLAKENTFVEARQPHLCHLYSI